MAHPCLDPALVQGSIPRPAVAEAFHLKLCIGAIGRNTAITQDDDAVTCRQVLPLVRHQQARAALHGTPSAITKLESTAHLDAQAWCSNLGKPSCRAPAKMYTVRAS